MSKPKIAVSVSDDFTARDALKIRKFADIVELRIDLFSSQSPAHVLAVIRKFGRILKIATIRSKKEGGQWKGSDAARLKLFRAVIPHVDFLDIELSSKELLRPVTAVARRLRKTVIVSYHNFKNTPSWTDLCATVQKAKTAGADIVKIAAFARSTKEVHRLACLTLRYADKQPLITVAMGEKGKPSRILFPKLGSLIAYTSLKKQGTAPGQWGLLEIRRFLLK